MKGGQEFQAIFEESFDSFFDSLHRYAFTFVKNSDLASDLVQTVFIKWWENQTAINSLDEAKKYLFTAVYRTSLNAIRDEKVKSARLEAYSYVHSQERQPDSQELEVLDKRIKEAIDSLPPQCKIIFCKSRFEDKRYSDIAAEMNLSIKTIEVQMGKALRVLREKLRSAATNK